MNLLLSHSIDEADGPIAARARALAAVHDFKLVLPERADPAKVKRAIRSCDGVIAVVGKNGRWANDVYAEVKAARAAGKPVLTLLEAPDPQLPGAVHLDRYDPSTTEAEILKLFHDLPDDPKARQAYIWMQVMASAVLVLFALAMYKSAEAPAAK